MQCNGDSAATVRRTSEALRPVSWYCGQVVLPHLVLCPTTLQDAHLVRCRVVAVTGKQRLSKHGCDLIVHAAFSSTPDHDKSCAADATGNEAEPAVIRTIADVLNTIFLRSDPGGTPLMSRMCIPPLGKAMESRTARLH
jgi:hypothetical protein